MVVCSQPDDSSDLPRCRSGSPRPAGRSVARSNASSGVARLPNSMAAVRRGELLVARRRHRRSR
eukprot:13275889-Heterocapsa_arctica.AAC.1